MLLGNRMPSEGTKRIRLAALYSHPIQYFAPLFRELSAQPDIDLTVYFCSRHGLDVSFDPRFGRAFKWDIPLLEGYRSVFLPNLRRKTDISGFARLVNPSIGTELIRQRYDALLVHGYEHMTKWLAFFCARLAGTPILLRGESQLLAERPAHIRAAKALSLRMLMRLVSACLYIGWRNREFYEYYGVSDDRLFFTPYVVDNVFFRSQAEQLGEHRATLRAALGVFTNSPMVLACGKLIEQKQPLQLLRAFQQVRREMRCALVYAGDGALRATIEQIVREEKIPDVAITGFLNQSKISEAYRAADVLVLPSAEEPWGLVVNEAMNFGLPIIVSDQVGCARDLVRPGENGFIFDYRSVESLAHTLHRVASDGDLRQRFGQRSLEIIADYTLERCAKGIVSAATAAMRARRSAISYNILL